LTRAHGDTSGPAWLDRLSTYALTLRAAGALDEAEAIYRQVLARQRAVLGSPHPDLAITLNNLAFLLSRREQFDEAAALYRESVDMQVGIFGPAHPNSLMLMGNLAGALVNSGRLDDGLDVLRERVDAARAAFPDGDWRVGTAWSALGQTLLRYGRLEAAEPALRAAVAEWTATLGADHAWTVTARGWIALVTALQGRTAAAATLFERNLERLRVARLDGDTRFNISAIADLLDEHGLADRGAAYRAIIADSATSLR
jgi:tetratricopeptide (TPR) repeat protein